MPQIIIKAVHIIGAIIIHICFLRSDLFKRINKIYMFYCSNIKHINYFHINNFTRFSNAKIPPTKRHSEILRTSLHSSWWRYTYFTLRNIHWRFNPPPISNFGELWEAAVKSSKIILKRSTFEEYVALASSFGGNKNIFTHITRSKWTCFGSDFGHWRCIPDWSTYQSLNMGTWVQRKTIARI